MKRTRVRSVFLASVIACVACVSLACESQSGPAPSAPPGVAMGSITVTSNAFPRGGQIPVDYSCDGKNMSPQLTWSAPPQGTKSLAIVLDDPDAPGGTFTHWILFNVAGETLTLAESADPAAIGARLGANDAHNVAYSGPCPPRGEMHRYLFHVYAIDGVLANNEGTTRAELDAALAGHVLGHGALLGGFAH